MQNNARAADSDESTVVAVILAAGKGKRMRSARAKVLHTVADGSTMLAHVMAQAHQASVHNLIVVVGHEREKVCQEALCTDATARIAVQEQQLGTGHAVAQAARHLDELAADQVLVLSGDVPLLRSDTIRDLLSTLTVTEAQGVVLSAVVSDPFGLGRIVRDKTSGAIVEIVEQKDCTPELARLSEINSGVYAFQWHALRSVLSRIDCSNAQNEYYLTDAVRLLLAAGHKVVCKRLEPERNYEIIGVNTPQQLEQVNRILLQTIDH